MNDDVTFWRWISDTTIGLVTETSVFHWTISDPTSPPQKIFDRHTNMTGTQIINYRATPDENWLVLVGISGNTTNPAAFKVKGSMQLYSRERNVSQPIEGHAAAFSELKLDEMPLPQSSSLSQFEQPPAQRYGLSSSRVIHSQRRPASHCGD